MGGGCRKRWVIESREEIWEGIKKLTQGNQTLNGGDKQLACEHAFCTNIYRFFEVIFSLKYELIGRALPHLLWHILDSPHSGTHGGIFVS